MRECLLREERMKSKILIVFLILEIFLAALSLRIYAFDDRDFQVWNTDAEELKISKSLKITLEEEFRFGDNANNFYYHHYDLGFVYDLNKYLNLGMGYRHIYEKKSGKFKEENEPYGMATLFWGLAGFKFDDRSRLEYRHFQYQTDSFRYRNKLTVKFPWKFTKLGIQPFFADEGFWSANSTGFNQNRFFSGLGMSLTKNLKAEIYYMLQTTKGSGSWIDTNVLGTKLKLDF